MSELARVPGFERLDANELAQLEALTTRQRIAAGTTVFFQDDPSDALYILLSGAVKVFQTSEDGRDRVLRILKAGNAFGDLAMIEGRPRFVSVQAVEDCEVLRLAREAFVPFANAHTWVLWTLLAAFAERIRTANDEMLDLAFRDVPYRLLRALNQLVQRHGEATPDGVRVAAQLSVEDLASMIGAHPESVQRLLDRYEVDGLIRRVGESWVVPDTTSLARTFEYMAQQDV